MENKVGVLAPNLLKELRPEGGACCFHNGFQIVCTSFPVSVTLKVMLVFEDMHLSCKEVALPKPVTSSGASPKEKRLVPTLKDSPSVLGLLRDGTWASLLRDL